LLIYLAGPIVEDAINREGPVADSNGVRSSVADKPRSLSSTGRLTVGRTLTTTCVHKFLHIKNKARDPPEIPNYPRRKWNQVKQACYGTLTEGSSSMVTAGGGAAARWGRRGGSACEARGLGPALAVGGAARRAVSGGGACAGGEGPASGAFARGGGPAREARGERGRRAAHARAERGGRLRRP